MATIEELVEPRFFTGPFFGLPVIWDDARSDELYQDLRNRVLELEDPDPRSTLDVLIDEPAIDELLRSIYSNSQFLSQCVLSDLTFLALLLTRGLDSALVHVFDGIRDDLGRETDVNRVKKELRIARKRVALLVAVADITGIWSLERVTQSLSDFADIAISAALSHLLITASEKGDIALKDEYFPEYECGYFALAMGKYGARELNYSSDIDLIVIYDPVKIDYRGTRSVQQVLIRLTRELVSILQDVTADGYVFRVDLRLRPDPGSTPVAIPYANALGYYETRGAGWERAAMIKARPAIGDLTLGRQFMNELAPFIWRTGVDFWAQREMAKIKRQINEHRGSADIDFFGHNIKLGRGGIREIEFFAQSHQLVYGGRDVYLRSTRTLDALSTLAEAGHIDDGVADELTEAYEFLRQLEHRLQMVNDQQTQTLPDDDDGMRRIINFMGYREGPQFRDSLLRHLQNVEATYSSVFDVEEVAAAEFDFQSDSPAASTLELLREAGFRDPETGWKQVAQWQAGNYAALRDPRCRDLIGELTPKIIEKAAAGAQPDQIVEKFDGFFRRMKASVSCLSILASNSRVFDFLFDALSEAPRITGVLERWPAMLESLAVRSDFESRQDLRVLRADCTRIIESAANRELAQQAVAEWANQQRLQIAEKVLRQSMDWTESGRAFSDIADAVIPSVYQSSIFISKEEGETEAAAIAVAAVGQFGAQEIGFSSPCDLLVFTAGGDDRIQSARRLACRLFLFLSAASRMGTSIDINFNETAYGTMGPIITDVGSFLPHCATEDGVWALLSLPQMRSILGPEPIVRDVEQSIGQFLESGTARRCLTAHIGSLLAHIHANASALPWDVRFCEGGLDELETLIACLQIKRVPDADVLCAGRGSALSKLVEAGELKAGNGKRLIEAHHLLRQVETFLTVATGRVDGIIEPDAQTGLALARSCGAGNLTELSEMLGEARAVVRTAVETGLAPS